MKDRKDQTPDDPLTREQWLRYQQHSPSELPRDEFARRAVRGLPYARGEEALRASLSRLDSAIERFAQPGAKRGRLRRLMGRLSIAAAVLVVLAVATALWLNFNSSSPQALYGANFEPLKSAIPLTGNLRMSEQERDLKKTALHEYENGRYDDAIPKFRAYLTQQPGDSPMRLYYGIALLATEEWQTALDELGQAYRQPAMGAYRHATQWYLALANLRLNDRATAVEHLRQLSVQSESEYYRRRATQLLRALNAGSSS